MPSAFGLKSLLYHHWFHPLIDWTQQNGIFQAQ